jgi:hypothetical protein
MKSTPVFTFVVAAVCSLVLASYVAAGSGRGHNRKKNSGSGFDSDNNPGQLGRTAKDNGGGIFNSKNNPGMQGSEFGRAKAENASASEKMVTSSAGEQAVRADSARKFGPSMLDAGIAQTNRSGPAVEGRHRHPKPIPGSTPLGTPVPRPTPGSTPLGTPVPAPSPRATPGSTPLGTPVPAPTPKDMVPLEPRVPGEVAPLDPPALQIIKRAPSPGAPSGD